MRTFDQVMIADSYRGWSHAEMEDAIRMLKDELRYGNTAEFQKKLSYLQEEVRKARVRTLEIERERDCYKRRCEAIMAKLNRKLSAMERVTGRIDLRLDGTKRDI